MIDTSKVWKIRRDPFYWPLCLIYGLKHIENAGFFFDSSDAPPNMFDDKNTLCTPFGDLNTKTITEKKTCVLLTTGGFAPIHNGHIEMMKAAKEAVEKEGWTVAAGYIAPDHDEYINLKCDHDSVDIFSRIEFINEAIADIDWLHVDPWAALFRKHAVNFTEIIFRLEYYLAHHLKQDVTVFFVCGGDNARFCLTFEKFGHCVVVGRPQYEQAFDDYKARASDRIIFTNGSVDLSSTEIRKSFPSTKPKSRTLTLISNEDVLEQQVLSTLEPYFSSISLVKKNPFFIVDKADDESISLDKDVYGKHNIGISRHYQLFGTKMFGYGSRPGWGPLIRQISDIETEKSYNVYDSDIHSGGTIEFLRAFLKKWNIDIKSVTAMNTFEAEETLDVDDFVIENGSGLVVDLPNSKVTRVPYVLPYVNCRARCSALDPIKFSLDIWEMNRKHFEENPKWLWQVPEFAEIFIMAGFDEDASMEDICQWHIELLS